MPAGVDKPWRGVRPLLPGVVGRLSAPTPATDPMSRHHSTLARPRPAACFCRPRRTPPLFYSTTSETSDRADAPKHEQEKKAKDAKRKKDAKSEKDAAKDTPAVMAWQAIAREGEDKRRREIEEQLRRAQNPYASQATDGAGSGSGSGSQGRRRVVTDPGTVMMDSIARTPLRPLHAPPPLHRDDPRLQEYKKYPTQTPAPRSALIAPPILHATPGETERSRKEHYKSIVRQGRLDLIRQMQDLELELVDWRQVLHRLAMSTPATADFEMVAVESDIDGSSGDGEGGAVVRLGRTTTGWRRNAVVFLLADDSLAVPELRQGVDDSLHAIWARTGCVLKLYRWRPAPGPLAPDSLDFTSRPWLLALSGGSEHDISRAVMDVVRIAPEAESVTLPAAELARLDGARDEKAREEKARDEKAREDKTREDKADKADDSRDSPWCLVSTSALVDSKHHDDVVFRPFVTTASADEVVRPAVWTRDSFERYVAQLVYGVLPPQLATDKYHRKVEQYSPPQPDRSHEAKRGGHPQPQPPSHVRTVMTLLHAAFDDESAREAVSLAAFKRALAFIVRHGESARPDMRSLFSRMEELRIPTDTDTFNIILGAYARAQDVRNFGTTLRLMRSRQHGHTPNLTTWLLFLRLFWSDDVKRHVLRTMAAKGLLGTARAVRFVAVEMADHDTRQALLDPAFDLDAFMAKQARRYGRRWLTRGASNRILDVLAGDGRFADCDRLLAKLQARQNVGVRRPRRPRSRLQLAKDRLREERRQAWLRRTHQLHNLGETDDEVPPVPPVPPGFVGPLSLDIFTYNIVLTHCKVQGDLDAALLILRRMEVAGAPRVPDGVTSTVVGLAWLPAIPPDSATFHLLFQLAWAHRLPHTMAVLWHYACIHRQLRHWMLLRASRELVDVGGKHVPLAHYLSGVHRSDESEPEPDELDEPELDEPEPDEYDPYDPDPYDRPPRSISGFRPVHQAGLDMATRVARRYDGFVPAEPLSKAVADAIARDTALRDNPDTPLAPMRVRLRAPGTEKEDEVVRGAVIYRYLEIPIPWAPFHAIEYTRS